MIIAQLLLAGVSEYERKSQRMDFDSLSKDHDVRLGEIAGADIVHIYAPQDFDPPILDMPYVSNRKPRKRLLRRNVEPKCVVTPLREMAETFIPEAVDESYFGNASTGQPGNRIGTFKRASVVNTIEQTAARIQRFRDDVDWL
ncbi:MAG: hypothetical protein QOE82_3496, partial [Thermoanaerobaculia bacterium]|nr:hypothetical protein [Thermoanaerobaculia bacterium]